MDRRSDRVLGCLLGAAYGDALGAPTEFLGLEQIIERWPPAGPDDLTRTPSRVTGLLCFLLFPDEPRRALQRAAASSGDSDSIACLAGSFAGAYHGMAAWSTHWRERIEYRERLERLAVSLA